VTTTVAALAATRALGADVRVAVPLSHRDLVECPPIAVLTTVMPNGYPQSSVVWCDFDGEFIYVNTMRGFAKQRNMQRFPYVSLLGYDPRHPQRCLETDGKVEEMTEAGALDHLNALASKYAGRSVCFFGDVVPAGFAEAEVPVICRIRPIRVVTHGDAHEATE